MRTQFDTIARIAARQHGRISHAQLLAAVVRARPRQWRRATASRSATSTDGPTAVVPLTALEREEAWLRSTVAGVPALENGITDGG